MRLLDTFLIICTATSMTPKHCNLVSTHASHGMSCYVQMVAAVPAGWLADAYRRDRVLKAAAAIGAVAGASLAIALLYQLPIGVLFGACALLGSYTGFNNAPLEALFADCIPRGKRCCIILSL